MIAALRIPGVLLQAVVVLPAAPIPGDIVEVAGASWRVVDRKFVVPVNGESEVVLTVEAA